MQQTAYLIQVAQVAPVGPPVGRHPVKQVKNDLKRVVSRLSPNVQIGQEVAKGRTVAGHVVEVSAGLVVEAGQQEDEL